MPQLGLWIRTWPLWNSDQDADTSMKKRAAESASRFCVSKLDLPTTSQVHCRVVGGNTQPPQRFRQEPKLSCLTVLERNLVHYHV